MGLTVIVMMLCMAQVASAASIDFEDIDAADYVTLADLWNDTGLLGFRVVTFTAYDFQTSAPTDSVSGIFVYNNLGEFPDGNPVLAVYLTIGGHQYTANEVLAGQSGTYNFIGAAANGLPGVGGGDNDFILGFDTSNNNPDYFGFSTEGSNAYWGTYSYSHFSVKTFCAPAPVPEPATMLLFGTGLIGLAGSRFRRKK